MKTIRTIGLIVGLLGICLCGYGQDQVRIMDVSDESAGRFKTQLYLIEGNNPEKLRGNAPTIEGSGNQVELMLKLRDLRWFEDKKIDFPVVVKRGDIVVSNPKGLQIASSPSEYTIEPKPDSEADIKFRVLSNGKYTLKIPFTANNIKGQYVQSLEVQGLSGGTSSTPIGNIADLKKEWRKVDKANEQAIVAFIDKHKSNPIAIEERIIAIAERTLLRVQKSNEELNDEEEKLWLEASANDDEELLQAFLDAYPDSKYAEAAKAKLGLEADVLIRSENESRRVVNTLTKLVDNVYHMDLSHLDEVKINISHPDDIEIFEAGKNLYDLKVQGSKKYNIAVTELSTGEQFDFVLDNRFSAKLDQKGNELTFSIDGGVSPYVVEFIKPSDETSKLEARFEGLKPNQVNEIVITNKMLSNSGMDGNYNQVTIRDFTTQAVSSFPIDIEVSPSKLSPQLIIGILLGLLVLGGAYMFFKNKRDKHTRQVYKEKAKVFQQTQKLTALQEKETTSMVDKEKKSPSSAPKRAVVPGAKKITITKPSKKFVPANGGNNSFKSSGKIKIVKREAKGGRLTGEEFRQVLEGDKYAFLDLTELWPDSAIKELYLSKECIKDLGKFLREENLDKVIAEMEGAIPEVGGFLMGYHQKNEAGHIRVTMDEFVPFVPEYHDVFKIEIGTATLVQELGDAQDTHPDKDVIGWFHTHPGHGLFLSNSDLSVQRHFPQKYQIAMEIDSLTETLDTAFFTRKMDGTINNVEHRKKGAKWFSWKKIENI